VRGDTRTLERIKFHYSVERRLADKLRQAPSSDRGRLYSSVYNELFESIPDHEQWQMKGSAEATRRETARQFGILRSFLRKSDTYCEIGSGDCALAIEVAQHVSKCYAVDVSNVITENAKFPQNLILILSDGTSVPVPEGTVDIVYSNQLMEHLHPEDVTKQIKNVYRALAPNGKYICITPNRLSGPHDISRYFDSVATCLHLREYSNGELKEVFSELGFRDFRAIFSWRSVVIPWLLPLTPILAIERLLERVSFSLRRRLSVPLGAIKFVAIK
jgi:ubiquinone/menaquinone biosynthesis C-methylase UbiE